MTSKLCHISACTRVASTACWTQFLDKVPHMSVTCPELLFRSRSSSCLLSHPLPCYTHGLQASFVVFLTDCDRSCNTITNTMSNCLEWDALPKDVMCNHASMLVNCESSICCRVLSTCSSQLSPLVVAEPFLAQSSAYSLQPACPMQIVL